MELTSGALEGTRKFYTLRMSGWPSDYCRELCDGYCEYTLLKTDNYFVGTEVWSTIHQVQKVNCLRRTPYEAVMSIDNNKITSKRVPADKSCASVWCTPWCAPDECEIFGESGRMLGRVTASCRMYTITNNRGTPKFFITGTWFHWTLNSAYTILDHKEQEVGRIIYNNWCKCCEQVYHI